MTRMSECVFCQIIRKEVPSNIVYEDDQVVGFLSNRPSERWGFSFAFACYSLETAQSIQL